MELITKARLGELPRGAEAQEGIGPNGAIQVPSGTDPRLEEGPEGAQGLVRVHAATRGASTTTEFGHSETVEVEHQEGNSSVMSRRA